MGEQFLINPRVHFTTASANVVSDASCARQVVVCTGWSSFLSLGSKLQGCGVLFVCCRHLGGEARFVVE